MKINSKNKNGGFSLVEIMMVVTIIAILSSTVTMSISRYVLERKGEAPVMEFYSQMQQLKSYAQRDNDRYLVKFIPDGPKAVPPSPDFEIYRDVITKDSIPDSDERVQLFANQKNIAEAIEIISSSPVGVNGINGYVSGWENNMIIFESDEIGTISTGAIFLENNHAKKIYYAIVRPMNENNLKLYKFYGSKWKEL